MERTISELRRLHADNSLDVVVLDYLEKAAASRRQLQMFGNNTYQREADNVEQLKIFCEQTGVPVLMVAQMSKAGKSESFERSGPHQHERRRREKREGQPGGDHQARADRRRIFQRGGGAD